MYKKVLSSVIASSVLLGTGGLIALENQHQTIHAKSLQNAYKSSSTKMTQGYIANKTTTGNGEKVKYVGIKGKDRNYLDIKNWKDEDKYIRAKDSWYNVGMTIDSKKFGNNVYLPLQLNQKTENLFNNGTLFNNKKFNDEYIKLVNKDRKSKGLKPLKYASYLQKGTDTRSLEMARYGSIGINGKGHIRPKDKSSFHTAHPNIPKPQYRLGENQGMFPFSGNPYQVVSEKQMAEHAFKSFKKSSGHYGLLMSKNATHITNSVKIAKDKNNYQNFIMTSTTDKY